VAAGREVEDMEMRTIMTMKISPLKQAHKVVV
jgi:hypothetical protein